MDNELLIRLVMVDAFGDLPSAPIPDPPAWYAGAACRGMDPALWFPEGRGSSPAAGLEVCEGCPVRVECGDYALAEGFEHGTWGGVTDRARRPQLDGRRFEPRVPRWCACGCARRVSDGSPGVRVLHDTCKQRRRRHRAA